MKSGLPNHLEELGIPITYRQYDYWASRGWIDVPVRKRGSHLGQLRFSDEQIDRIRLIAHLTATLGCSPEHAAWMLDTCVIAGEGTHLTILLDKTVVEVQL